MTKTEELGIKHVQCRDRDKALYIGVSRDGWDELWNGLPTTSQTISKDNAMALKGWMTLKVDDVVYFMYPCELGEFNSAALSERENMIFLTGLIAGETGVMREDDPVTALKAEAGAEPIPTPSQLPPAVDRGRD